MDSLGVCNRVMHVPEKINNNRIIILSVCGGRVECLPGQTLIDFYRSEHPAPTFQSSAEVAAKTSEAKQRIFKINPNKKFK